MDYDSYKLEIYNTCVSLFKEGVEKYNQFLKNEEYDKYIAEIPTREEYTVTSRYLHRGYYCPSPLFDDLCDNTRKGKLHIGPTKRKKVSNRYLYNSNDELYLVESYYPNSSACSREFIWRERNKRYGLSFYDSGELFAISVETFKDGKPQSYMYLLCHILSGESLVTKYGKSIQISGVTAFDAVFETYIYHADTIIQYDFSRVFLLEELEKPMLSHDRYIPIYENGNVVSFEHVRLKR